MRAFRLLLLTSVLAGCAAAPAGDVLLLVDALPARSLRSDEPEEASVVLERFLDSLGPAVTDRRPGRALVRERDRGAVRLAWDVEDDRLRVQAVDAYEMYHGHPGELIAALAYHLRAAGISFSSNRYSGCRLPPELADSEAFGDALAAVFSERGLVPVDMEIGQEFNQTVFGTPDGEPRWHVDRLWACRASPDSIEFFHDAEPLDAAGEEELLLDFLGRLTAFPVEFEQRVHIGEGYYMVETVDD